MAPPTAAVPFPPLAPPSKVVPGFFPSLTTFPKVVRGNLSLLMAMPELSLVAFPFMVAPEFGTPPPPKLFCFEFTAGLFKRKKVDTELSHFSPNVGDFKSDRFHSWCVSAPGALTFPHNKIITSPSHWEPP